MHVSENASREELQRVLEQCQVLMSDVYVQIELSKKYGTDYTALERSRQGLESRIKELEKLTRRGWFF